MLASFKFADIDEDEHRFSRYGAFIIAVCVAILPFVINVVWRIVEANTIVEVTLNNEIHRVMTDKVSIRQALFDSGITDLAFAGVVVSVSTFTNTYFSIKLLGWRQVSWKTFISLLFVAITALFSFVGYIQGAHDHINTAYKGEVFFATLCIVLSNIIFSYIAHACFLADEFRSARESMRMRYTEHF